MKFNTTYNPESKTQKKKLFFWYQGKLIHKSEHDKLSVDEIRASNDIIRKKK